MHPTESLWDISEGGEPTADKAFSNVFRTKADVGSGSYIGFTLTDKELGGGTWSRLGGIDGQLRFKDRVFFNFQALASSSSLEGDRTSLAPGLYGELYYTTKHWTFGGYYKAMHPEFQASLGFVNRTDYSTLGGFASYRIYPDKKYLNQVQFRLQAGRTDGYADSVTQNTWIRPQVQFRLTEFNQIFVSTRPGWSASPTSISRSRTFSIESQITFISWMPFNFFFETGDSINYDPEDAFLGYSNTYGISATFKPSKRLQLGTDFSKQTFWRHGRRRAALGLQRHPREGRPTRSARRSRSGPSSTTTSSTKKLSAASSRAGSSARARSSSSASTTTTSATPYGHLIQDNYNVFVKFSYWWRL